ncbi:uncharacterized protein LODBEIA_P29110 [Lodderomyces beijingensis]|uniref:Aminotransferase class V domain-containing protein n=1 Tax=Lodderomyces beijingensis TaxID=1775926 RepID=A0ABP0ZR27_9ASCO
MILSWLNLLSVSSPAAKPNMIEPETPFGKQFREKYFPNLDKEVYPVNHGSYGLTPKPVHDKYLQAITENAAYPDKFLKYDQKHAYVAALKILGQVLNCDYHNLAIVDNATTGVNTCLRSYPFKKGDSIVIQSTVYGACGNTVKFLKDNFGIEFHVVDLEYPVSDKDILQGFEDKFKKFRPALCMFDTISSMPGVIFPHKQMVQLCKKYNVLSLIDGAHGIGCIPQNLDLLKPDFYVSNLHKWFYVPFGCAVLYVDPKHHRNIHTLPISHSYLSADVELPGEQQKNRLIDRFFFTGTKNFASIQVIPDAHEFRQTICGGERTIYDYCHNLAVDAGNLVSKKWGTQVLDSKDSTLISTMVTVEVPTNEFPSVVEKWSSIDDAVYRRCMGQYKAYTPCLAHNGKLWARFSAQVYNELSDYEVASDVLLKVLKEVSAELGLLAGKQ